VFNIYKHAGVSTVV